MADSNPSPPSADVVVDMTEAPPTTIPGILRRLGPGMILAGSIVGSGELIATTKTAASAGFDLLWLIIIGCIIKVFCQIELGRYTIVNGRTTMDGLNEVPGPRLRVNWILWYWAFMFLTSLGQLGGIVGGVGQGITMTFPLTADGKLFNEYTLAQVKLATAEAKIGQLQARQSPGQPASPELAPLLAEKEQWTAKMTQVAGIYRQAHGLPADSKATPTCYDDYYWAAVVTVITSVLLVVGRYGLVQNLSTAMVAGFTFMTVVAVAALQTVPAWAITGQNILDGLRFRLGGAEGLGIALGTFGIIGVGANELLSYPYWCLEKGYARSTGPRDNTEAWGERARGWMKVMRWDAWCSMVVYTFATLAFYLLGASVLNRSGLNPESSQMMWMLSEMYAHLGGAFGHWLFLFGAFAVLYSTFFVASAGHARVTGDAMRVFGMVDGSPQTQHRVVMFLSGLFPFICLGIFLAFPSPTVLVLFSGAMQAIMLPFLGVAALYFRYRQCDPRVVPGQAWDVMLWVSTVGLFIFGGGAAWSSGSKMLLAVQKLLTG